MLRNCILILLTGTAIGGCATVPLGISEKSADAIGNQLAESTKPLRRSWRRVTTNTPDVTPLDWQWVTAIPVNVPRAELITATMPTEAVVAFLPQEEHHATILASTDHARAPFQQISALGDIPVQDFARLHAITNDAIEKDETVKVQLTGTHQPGERGGTLSSYAVKPATLLSLSQAAAPNAPELRVNEGGNPWVLIREGGIRCKMMSRVDRESATLQVVVSLANYWEANSMLPAELRASCEGQPLRCLTVAETLEMFYGEPDRIEPAVDTSYSFAAVSEQEDYLMPTNFRRLEETQKEKQRNVMTPRLPAFATIAGTRYPGPAELGDARALSGFLLQRQIYAPSESEHTGWIVFGGEALREGNEVVITLALRSGERQLRFKVPK